MDKVRLTKIEIDTILEESTRIFGDNLARVKLYGSRADLTKKGGDIDLMIELFNRVDNKFALTQELRQSLKSRLGDQKFDILLMFVGAALNTDRENTFLLTIQDSLKILWSFDE